MTAAGEMREALHAGRRAAEQKQPSTCPHDGTGATARERVLARLWRIGYQSANPVRAED